MSKKRTKSSADLDPHVFWISREYGIDAPTPEHLFAASIGRRWRFDYAWPEHKIALEVEGGVWIGGRHSRPSGFTKDIEKYNTAAVMGWRLIRCQPKQLLTAKTWQMVKDAIHRTRESPPA